MSRPFMQDATIALKQKAQRNWNNASVLAKIHEELEHRSRKLARELHAELAKRLGSLKKTQTKERLIKLAAESDAAHVAEKESLWKKIAILGSENDELIRKMTVGIGDSIVLHGGTNPFRIKIVAPGITTKRDDIYKFPSDHPTAKAVIGAEVGENVRINDLIFTIHEIIKNCDGLQLRRI